MSYTLLDILEIRKEQSAKGITFIDGSSAETFLSYKELYQSAARTLYNLQRGGLQSGDELVFQVDNNRTFIICFWACILGGIIPVPLTMGQNDEHKKKLFKVWPFLNNPFLLIDPKGFEKMAPLAADYGFSDMYDAIAGRLIDESCTLKAEMDGKIASVSPDDIAFIQFSSGSTGNPKGVTLTHRNLITNIKAISEAACYTEDDALLSWMPLTHDMGLIGFHLNPLYSGVNQYLIPTVFFIRRPAIWLEKASEHKVSIICSPNFGYSYTLKNCNPGDMQNCDLSNIRIIFNGAEPISLKLCREFVTSFAAHKLNPLAMRPVYGLAEASLAVSISTPSTDIDAVNLNRHTLRVGDKIAVETGHNATTFVNVGRPVSNCSVRIAGENGEKLTDETIGYVFIKGDNVTAGYYNNTEETRKILQSDGWLKTGDLGFFKNGELYITGRAKDIIFVNGMNYYPHDIENLVEAALPIGLNKVVVTGYVNSTNQENEIAAFVFHRGSMESFAPLSRQVSALINQKTGLKVNCVLPVKVIPRTTSGKLQRFVLQNELQNGVHDYNRDYLHTLLLEMQAKSVIDSPVNATETALLAIWKQILEVDTISCTTSFFEAGGNSLTAAALSMQVLKEFNIDLPVEAIYQYQTIRAMGAMLSNFDKAAYVPIGKSSKSSAYPLSPAQKRLYYTWQLDKFSISYNMPVIIKITGQPDTEKLQEAIRDMIRRHAILRVVIEASSEPMMKIREALDFNLHVLPCSALDKPNELLKSLIQPFDLNEGELFRIKMVTDGTGAHYLFMDFHHIISDGLSVTGFIKELFALYQGKEVQAPAIEYTDFTAYLTQQGSSSKYQKSADYWHKQLAGELPLLALPGDYSRPVIFDNTGGKIEFTLPASTVIALKKFAAANSCTFHVLMLALYRLFLCRYTGQYDMIIGIPVSGRNHPDIQQTLGMFVNNLAIRNSMVPTENFIDLLLREKDTVSDALQFQDFSFNEVLEMQVGKSRDISRNPVFDTMFVYQNMVFPCINIPGLTIAQHFIDPGTSKYDLSMEVFDFPGGMKYFLEYSNGIFDKSTVENMAKYFNNMMNNVLEAPGENLCKLSLLDKPSLGLYGKMPICQREKYPHNATIHKLFELQVQQTPDAVSIDYEGKEFTYRELNDQANQLACILKKRGIGPGSITAILLKRSPALIISIMAVLKTGACYLPIDDDLPEERISYLITDSGCGMLITGSLLECKIAGNRSNNFSYINIDKTDLSNRNEAAPVFETVHNPAALAYIIYTSGTTGKPKGVMIAHRSLVNYISWAAKVYVKNQPTAFPLFTSISFDLTVTSVFTPLVTGNRIVIYKDSLDLAKIFAENKCDIMKLTPSHLKLVVQENKILPRNTQFSIKKFIVGGENLETRLVQALQEKIGNEIEVFNEYGPTEATVGCMIYSAGVAEKLPDIPIGRPAQNTGIYILDKYLQPVAPGIPGEIYIAGDCVGIGYLHMEALTAQKFLPDPFNEGRTMYKTGDLAKQLADGNIAYLGRYDEQVKINGYRIELAEIKEHLMCFKGISDCLVIAKENGKKQQSIIAYYVSGDFPAAISEEILKHWLANRLPNYMVPAHFVQIIAIPLTTNGKPDTSALPEPWGTENKTDSGKAMTEIELASLQIWKDVLGTSITVNDNFFEVGGDSIKAVQIVSRLRDAGISIAVKDLLTYHTIRQVSRQAHLVKSRHYYQGVLYGLKALSPIESWFFSQQFENPGYYNQSVLLNLSSKVDAAVLNEACKLLIHHYDELRLNYDAEKNELFYNERHLEKNWNIPVITASDEELAAVCTKIKSGFNIQTDLLFSAVIINNSTAKKRLFLTAHHLVVDGISWRTILQSLYDICNNIINATVIQLPPKTASLVDWHGKLLEYASSENLGNHYWNRVAAHPFAIPVDIETDNWQNSNAVKLVRYLGKNDTECCLGQGQLKYQADMQVLLNTALALALQNWLQQDEFVIEQENHGRHLEDIDASRTAGWFTVMYPAIIKLHNGNMREQIKSVKEQLKKVPNKGMGYGIQKYMANSQKEHAAPITEIRCNYLGQFGNELQNDLFSFSNMYTGSETDPHNKMTVKFELNCMIIKGELQIEITYNKSAYLPAVINRFADDFLDHIKCIAAHLNAEDEIQFTPSDFDGVLLNQEELDLLF